MAEKNSNSNKKGLSEENMKKLVELLESTQYGSVTLVVQDGVVIQIERNEKVRLK